MMRKISIILLLVFALSFLLMPALVVRAGNTASVVDTTVPVPSFIKSAVDAWLVVSPPSSLPYYAITYIHDRGTDTFVSLAALNITRPNDVWHITDHTVAWMGSVLVHADQSVTMFSAPQSRADQSLKVFAIPNLAPGGGADIRFPWDAGKKMMYGESALHPAGGGGAYAVGFDAVDFLGGTDLGSGVASPNVYASYAGIVDYVCADATTTLVRTADETSDNRFIYAHLLDNANLVEEHAFAKGALIGVLKKGTFDDECGWADQTELHYHLHFGFEMANNAYRIENCIINTNNEKWMCGATEVAPGEYLLSSTTPGGGTGTLTNNPSFWDMVLVSFTQLWDGFVINNLPNHQAFEFVYVLYNTVGLLLKIAWVMVYSNINLGHLMAVIFLALVIKAVFGVAELVMFLLKAYNSIFPKIPGIG